MMKLRTWSRHSQRITANSNGMMDEINILPPEIDFGLPYS